ncbi:CYTH domain-containing protein [Burkholderiaceae bacterium UC74_6]
MGVEIERKFLVTGEDWKRSSTPQFLSQGYLNRDKQRTVRVRIAGDEAWLTIKGQSQGATRAEFEYAVPLADAQQLLAMCDGPRVEKNRWRVPHGGLVWEVDEFLGENAGLVVAEVELTSEDQRFDKPTWAGAEVTDDPRYFNSSLAGKPYSSW